MVSQNLEKLRKIKTNFENNIKVKEKLVERLNNYKVSDKLPDLRFKDTTLIENYLLYAESLLIKDIAANCQVGLTILKVKALKDIEFKEHTHIYQSQTVYVEKGQIINLKDNMSFTEGQSYFTSKKNAHKIKYLEGAEIIIVYLPSLEII